MSSRAREDAGPRERSGGRGGTRRPRRRAALAFPVLLPVLGGCAGGFGLWSSPPEPVSAERGEYVEVVCYFECGTIARDALRTAEAAWRLTAVYLGSPPEVQGERFPSLHLYGSFRDYEIVEDAIAGGRFRDYGGFSSRDTREAHLPVPSHLPSGVLERIGLPALHSRAVAHEAAHLAAYELAEGAYWPLWLAEGLAGWVEREVVASGGAERVHRMNPWASTRLWRVQRLLQDESTPSVDAILQGRPMEISVADAYSLWTEVFHFLARGPYAADMRRFIRTVADEPIPEERAWEAVGEILEASVGSDVLAEVDDAFRDHVARVGPAWVEIFRSVQPVSGNPGQWFQHSVMGMPTGALAWRTADAGEPPGFVAAGTVEPVGGGEWEVRIPLDREDDDPLVVAVRSQGDVRLLEFAYETADEPTLLEERPVASSLPLDGRVDLAVQFQPGEVAVRVGVDRAPVAFDVPGARPTGMWGIGVAPDSYVVWSRLRTGTREIFASP